MDDHRTISLSSLSYIIIPPISFSHAAHADQVKRDFLGSASNSVFFLDSLRFIVPPSYGSFVSLGLCDHKPELTVDRRLISTAVNRLELQSSCYVRLMG